LSAAMSVLAGCERRDYTLEIGTPGRKQLRGQT